jgi:CRISPR-associated endonuclease Csn1
VWELSKVELQKRLYKIVGLSSTVVSGYLYGTISLVHHQEARPSSEVKLVNGVFSHNEKLRPGIKMLHTQIRALVAGTDFKIDELGEIKRLI